MARNAYQRQMLWATGHRYCAYCALRLAIEENRINTLTVDHVVPRAKGGRSSRNNVTAACKLCNELKANQVKVPKFCTKTREPLTRSKGEKP